jgi:fluoroacetyl-CoA thioesterase
MDHTMTILQPGLSAESTMIVQAKYTAGHLGSGGVDVLATPIMIGLMEDAARRAVDPLLEPGQMSVGVNLNVTHLAATPVGLRVTARAELTAVDGRRLTFKVEAFDEKEKIGDGTHTRAIIDLNRFMAKARDKAAPPGH